MNKKSLEKVTNIQNYAQQIFNAAKVITQNCVELNNINSTLNNKRIPAIQKKKGELQTSLKAAINAFGKLNNLQKAPLATAVDHGLQIFEAITDCIETASKKYRDGSKNNKQPKQQANIKKASRPQEIYGNIKPAVFDFHSHQKTLDYIRTDCSYTKSASIDQQLIYVDTPKLLQKMIEQLITQNEIAVDVQHCNKSYQGFTCLLQFSSRQKDYIIDVFPIWQHVPLLKRLMENEKIVKVMHGAEMDTKWFQRDFNIHIVNLFDTYRAARVLGLQKLSYAFLLNHYCSVLTDKKYQLADWRQRPLSKQMLHYARIDTHYLLQIFDFLRRDLHQKALSMNLNPQQVIQNVYAASYEVTKNQVQLFNFRNKEFYIQLKKDTKEKDFVIFEKVFSIMDDIARTEDIGYDELVSHKMERQIITRLKEMLYLKSNQNILTKIDRFITVLKQSQKAELVENHIDEIRKELLLFFESYNESEQVSVKKNKGKKKSNVMHFQEYKAKFQPVIEEITIQKPKIKVNFQQFGLKTYQTYQFNPFNLLKFEPITSFLAQKQGINQRKQQDEEAIDYQQVSQEQSSQEDEVKNQEEQQQAQEGVIEFKRMNPNVIYTIEQDPVAEQSHHPRKKRKEYEYQQKLKSKEGNIYELLQD